MTREKMENRSDELAQEHWNYIFELLKAHNIHKDHMEIASFHYIEAFKHGYKHCWEDLYLDNIGKIVMIDPKEYKK